MGGPVLVIESAQAVPRVAIERLREFLLRTSTQFEEKRVGEYDLSIAAESLGISDTGTWTDAGPPPPTRSTSSRSATVLSTTSSRPC
ncbi:DUF6368 family protein [Streptomyces sp. NPDC029554]|uniref:DUF6368 family protein n=1 Tax=unclassified Streptomyces TaxID=2593676 RepID=UPI0033C16FF0